MPLHNYQCEDCKVEAERLVKRQEADHQTCLLCEQPMRKLFPLVARMNESWSGNWTEGLSSAGKYDHGLGQMIYSEKQRDSLLSKKGWVRESDLDPNSYERTVSARKEQIVADNKKTKQFVDNIAKYDGDKERAIIETFPAKEMLATTDV